MKTVLKRIQTKRFSLKSARAAWKFLRAVENPLRLPTAPPEPVIILAYAQMGQYKIKLLNRWKNFLLILIQSINTGKEQTKDFL
ncbi:hypothetical protein BWD09_11685 [Neisseria dentiae]|uniref:Uncharacterized protein n=1 Tax=Neisseria dentiae TaxID=194197 RepID=A0A1X3D2L6_9NEIS|nr:hypothetical protein [Neisseria dentiae]OSI14015.1 hypothetical protein BWD09_11685 [Neisseria dentiae]QMT44440.1 hypothetical protein H3L92_08130 [Neisseria dentiae]